jgi:hypothetical protein
MPAMLRPDKKLEKIAFDVLGEPMNKVVKKKHHKRKEVIIPVQDREENPSFQPRDGF